MSNIGRSTGPGPRDDDDDLQPTLPPTLAASGSQSIRRKGPTTGAAIEKAVRASGGRLPITFEEGMMIPTGENASEFVNSIGVFVRHHIPTTYKNWKSVPEDTREAIVHRLHEQYAFDMSNPVVSDFVIKKMKKLYNYFRSSLSKHYKAVKSEKGLEVARATKHHHVSSMTKWHRLCDQWETPQFKKLSTTNSENRLKMKYNHKSGSKPFARKHAEMKKLQKDGEPEITGIDVFRATHADENDKWINDEAKKDYTDMVALLNRPTHVDGVDHPVLTPEEVMVSVRGYRLGYVKGVGEVKTSKTSSSSSSSRRSRDSTHVKEMRQMMESQKVALDASLVREQELQAKYDTDMQRRDEDMAELRSMLRTQQHQIDSLLHARDVVSQPHVSRRHRHQIQDNPASDVDSAEDYD